VGLGQGSRDGIVIVIAVNLGIHCNHLPTSPFSHSFRSLLIHSWLVIGLDPFKSKDHNFKHV
ncbi:hypothetical protein A2U01_0039960, partial [Trifolium medium]|nr:hypothetical protein [Trifolium medium]